MFGKKLNFDLYHLTTLALLDHANTTFVWHEVSLQFGIKCCFLLVHTLGSRTLLGVTIYFVIRSHIISSWTNERSIVVVNLPYYATLVSCQCENLEQNLFFTL